MRDYSFVRLSIVLSFCSFLFPDFIITSPLKTQNQNALSMTFVWLKLTSCISH